MGSREDLRSLPVGGRRKRDTQEGALGQLGLSALSGAAGIYSFKLTVLGVR